MVILGGLELVAAGYIIHKHQQNKRDKQRIEEEAAALEEENYRIFPQEHRHSSSQHRRHRSHSQRRHSSRERRHSFDGKHEYRRESPRPARSAMKPTAPPQSAAPPMMAQQSMRPPPPYNNVPTATPQPPQDIKYGWTDEPVPQQHRPQQDPNDPPTGWPTHWAQSQTPDPGARLRPGDPRAQYQHGEPSRGRSAQRASSESPHVRFAVPRHTPQPGERSESLSPPPSYRE